MGKKKMLILLTCVVVVSLTVACGDNAGAAHVPIIGLENDAVPTESVRYRQGASETTIITLNGNSITVDGDGAVAEGSRVTVTAAGTYSLSGHLDDGQIIVNAEDADPVVLLLDGVDIHNSTGAPITIQQAEEAVIVLEDTTENVVADGTAYSFENTEYDEPTAAIFSEDELTITGNGTLSVVGNFNDGIASKDGLTINSGTIMVRAVDDGIRGKDYLVVNGGHITVNAQGDGLKSDSEDDPTQGYVTIETGTLNISAGGDAIQAQTNVTVTEGNITLLAGGGSNNWVDESLSAKGIKAATNVTINGGTFTIDAADDAIHSNDRLVINAGTFILASGDDGMHADSTLEVNGGDITISRSYEGIESAVITINDGAIDVTSSDDGLNVAGGNDGSGMMRDQNQWGRPDQGRMPGGQPGQGGMPGQDGFAATGDYHLYINGGHTAIAAAGDGIDANGTIEMTNGIVIINGPTENMNGALDHVGFTLTGGYLVAAGSSGMAQGPDETSAQNSVMINFDSMLAAGTLVNIQSSAGEDLLTFAPAKDFQSIAFSSSDLVAGATYSVYTGGTASGMADSDLFEAGTYTPGTQVTDFTVSSAITWIGGQGQRGPGRW